LSTTIRRCRSLVAMLALTNGSSIPAAAATCTRAFVSFGRQDPPHPGPGCRNACPIRRSCPMPSVTSATSAPSTSQSSASALTYDSFIARKQLAAYFTISALAASVSTVGAPSRE
jgi:hypothetical protein